jgi:RNA polymerase sigma-70 factor (ECF subfamily)
VLRCEPGMLDLVAFRSSEELVVALQSSDREAISAVYREHHAALRTFARRLLGDPESAEDLVQDVFVRLPRALSHYRFEGDLRAFLFGMAANRCRHHLRAAKRRRDAMYRLALDRQRSATRPHDEAFVTVFRAQLLQRALDRLPIDQRTAFVLCEVEQCSTQEASAILGVPEGTVKSRCFHARKKLRA